MIDPAVRAVQDRLIRAGFPVGRSGADGIWGRDTSNALAKWQADNELKVSGIVDPATHDKMFGGPPMTVAHTNLGMPWISEAKRHLGLQETKGPGTNQTILGWLVKLHAGWRDDETPWCATFTGICIATALPAEPLPANPFGALQWAKFGVSCEPTEGCVLVFTRPGAPGSGHVGFYMGEDDEAFFVLGGNQGDEVKVARVPKSRLYASRWPKTVALGATRRVRMTSAGALSVNEA